MRAVCSVLFGVLTLSIDRLVPSKVQDQRHCSGVLESAVGAQVPLQNLAVGLQRGRSTLLTLATFHDEKMFDNIYCFTCFTDDQAKQ